MDAITEVTETFTWTGSGSVSPVAFIAAIVLPAAVLCALGCFLEVTTHYRGSPKWEASRWIKPRGPKLYALISATLVILCAAGALGAVAKVMAAESAQEEKEATSHYYEADGTVASVNTLQSGDEDGGGETILGIRLQEAPQVMLTVTEPDTTRFLGAEGTRVDTLYCNPHDTPEDPYVLECSLDPDSVSPSERGPLGMRAPLPDHARQHSGERTPYHPEATN